MKQLLFYTFLAILTIFACKKTPPMSVQDGQEILRVSGDTIITKEGGVMVLDSLYKVYYLIRHAEKDSVPVGNPALTEKGLKRSVVLSDILRATRVDAIYSTFFTRTLYTVDSLADIKAMPILPYEVKSLRNLVDQIQSDKNTHSVVIVGHSNSTPSLANSLAGFNVFDSNFDESDYDNFVIVYEKTNGTKGALKLKWKVE